MCILTAHIFEHAEEGQYHSRRQICEWVVTFYQSRLLGDQSVRSLSKSGRFAKTLSPPATCGSLPARRRAGNLEDRACKQRSSSIPSFLRLRFSQAEQVISRILVRSKGRHVIAASSHVEELNVLWNTLCETLLVTWTSSPRSVVTGRAVANSQLCRLQERGPAQSGGRKPTRCW
eukprot:417753-Hanusia_phi.AAC.2